MNKTDKYQVDYENAFQKYDLKKAVEVVMAQISWLDLQIQTTEPFKVIKINQEEGGKMILQLVKQLAEIAHSLLPLLPQTSAKILECIRENKMPEKPLFNRLP